MSMRHTSSAHLHYIYICDYAPVTFERYITNKWTRLDCWRAMPLPDVGMYRDLAVTITLGTA